MKFEILSKFYKIQGLVIVFYSVWIALLLLNIALIFVINEKYPLLFIGIPVLLISSVIFSIWVNRKMKQLNKRFELEK